jgi:hypothetical protein
MAGDGMMGLGELRSFAVVVVTVLLPMSVLSVADDLIRNEKRPPIGGL